MFDTCQPKLRSGPSAGRSIFMYRSRRLRLHISCCISILVCLSPLPIESKDNPLQSILRRLTKNKGPPKPVVIDNFLTPEEAAYLLDRYEFLMHASQSRGYTSSKATQSKYRTSRSVRLPPLGDETMFDIERRAATLAGFNHSYCEDIQMACYEEDELHGLHRDDADGTVSADRAATVLIYLQRPEGGGGETLFTMKEIEKERDGKTGGPLSTEQGALDLFRSYCDKPKKNMVVVEPQVGRAVTWRNWLGEDFATFAKCSTHGACPVKGGKKCVIQQWIGRKTKLPLRDERVGAIFTAGADVHYRKEDAPAGGEVISRCLQDASAMGGRAVPTMCAADETVKLEQLDDGPYKGVGALRISGSLMAEIPSNMLQNGMTISFWVRDMTAGRTIVSLQDTLSLVYTEKGDITQTFELRAGEATEQIKVYSSGSSEQWYWFSLAIQMGKRVSASIYSRGKLDGTASVNLESCSAHAKSADVALHLFPAQDGEGEIVRTDISFVVMHQAVLDDPKEVLELGQQSKRYDKNS